MEKSVTSLVQGKKPIKYFLASLPSLIKDEELRDYFSSIGVIKSLVVARSSKKTQCKGHGVITFSHIYSRDPARYHFIGGRRITCERYIEGEELKLRKFELEKSRVFVSNLPYWMEDHDLWAIAEQFGQVDKAYRIRKHGSRVKCKFGYVHFEDIQAAERCLSQGFVISGQSKILFQPFTKDFKKKKQQRRYRGNEIKANHRYQGHHERADQDYIPNGNFFQTKKMRFLQNCDKLQKNEINGGRLGFQRNLLSDLKILFRKKMSMREVMKFHMVKPMERDYWYKDSLRRKYFFLNQDENLRINRLLDLK